MTDTIWALIPAATQWLDAANGRDESELSYRILKVTEEAGEVASAWIGVRGQNPRKGTTHTKSDVAAELADVVITALVAIESLGLDARATLETTAAKVHARMTIQDPPADTHEAAGPSA
ncbi:MazG-like family protein [Asanoa siamensis]|uniref:MazG-like family protein n=1 Tax=Asanoa siamensis TaxID=926357 RepID=UPI00194274CC|nr:MazG-like family protein [Asanoa siamensis]